MKANFRKQIRIYSLLFLISVFLTFFTKYIKPSSLYIILLSIFLIFLILFGTVLLISKTKKDNFEILSLIISLLINVLNFIGIINIAKI